MDIQVQGINKSSRGVICYPREIVGADVRAGLLWSKASVKNIYSINEGNQTLWPHLIVPTTLEILFFSVFTLGHFYLEKNRAVEHPSVPCPKLQASLVLFSAILFFFSQIGSTLEVIYLRSNQADIVWTQ